LATSLKSFAPSYSVSPQDNKAITSHSFHWSMRLFSLVSLLALALYSYVLKLCRHRSRQKSLDQKAEKCRVRFATLAFTLDMLVSVYFGAATPILLAKGGLVFNRKSLPRPLFWFFAITGLLPTASMALTVIGGQRWQKRIGANSRWRSFHAITGLIAYISWWIACSPILFIAIFGEKRTLELLKKSQFFVSPT